MIRKLLGEPSRVNKGILLDAMNSMSAMLNLLERQIQAGGDPTHDFRKADILTRGLMSSLDELEQSHHASAFFRMKVKAGYAEDMSEDEKSDYALYVFFYKDGFVRVFSILDKLGNWLNDLYDLKTGQYKAHYSYFTVLRQLKYLKMHPVLTDNLNDIKDTYNDAINRLRKRRNTEIHYMNTEMQDDLWQRHRALYGKIQLEDLDHHLEDLQQGLEMVCRSLSNAFTYTAKQWENRAVRPKI
ncbi:Cthe_2314 family HEPN domain-containing protein [Paenibacillus sp. FSL P2-0322]|uniref:Cthe_2314 family HEPN domain-containing protein n=1 Tax=Paenibacillus sp. FSL P2-0322 TaxID=2921628 RepID=UPI0030D0117A